MALLGDDGRGYDLARRLESYGVWRPWLGDSLYANFIHFLSSSSSWEAFMRADNSKPRAQIHLQLRARALLFDKASVSLFLAPPLQSSSASISKFNPNYFQLYGDDVYFTFEDCAQHREDVLATKTAPLKAKTKHLVEMESKFCETSNSLNKLMEEKDKLHQSYNEEIKKIQSSAREHFLKIFNDHEKLKLQLESQKKDLELQGKELEKPTLFDSQRTRETC